MFKILQKTFEVGAATVPYPDAAPVISGRFRGKPEFVFERWADARPAAEACPTGAIACADADGVRRVTVDYGRCIFCGECEAASPDAVHMTREFDLAALDRQALVLEAGYRLNPDGTHAGYVPAEAAAARPDAAPIIHKVFGRSLAIRQVDAGSCNGCELEITALNNPVHDIERFGIHFVASPRHADMLLVTGPVTRNMELALQKTYAAMPEPRLVVAAGACGISGGIFGTNYASLGGVGTTIPVHAYVPGCPPRPEALLYGILLTLGRLRK